MKKHTRIIVGKKTGRRGHMCLASKIIVAKNQYVTAMRALEDTNKEEVQSLAAITARLSKAGS